MLHRRLGGTYRESLKQHTAEMEKSKGTLPKDQQPALNGVTNSLKQQLQRAYAAEMAEHGKRLAAWEEAYPANNPKPMIKQWLAVFLEKSADVDFEAQITEVKPGVTTFVNMDYERKDKLWKMLFRAGKDTVTAARAVAQEWLAELNP